ncbi:MAG TPA: lamin tail domain-containing protein [Phycisphaerae bacterium]|nr:lamin tail domain-containing protein [Phycisphaerae bacterium]HRY69914.1 lamin tail domain-containing protein [Phycisphaerae bacterium]HSA27123.1 lamin tail domain-containing protein [Phycisphaerae bacterium]
MDLRVAGRVGFRLSLLVVGACVACGHPALASGEACSACEATGDQRIDAADLDVFVGCVTGPALGPPAASCGFADLDQDGDVDQVDFGLFQNCFGLDIGPSAVFISEFMAEDNRVLPDDHGDWSDWIEIYNSGSSAVNLGGWYLTDDPAVATKWRFPEVELEAFKHLVVFASGQNRVGLNGELHTNFQLDASGEYLALVKPDGLVVASAFAPAYPKQKARASYGLRAETLPTAIQLIGPGAACRYLVPASNLGLAWTATDYPAESAWTQAHTGIGYERNSAGTYDPLIASDGDVEPLIYNQSKFTIYIRIPFTVDHPLTVTKLTLKMKYDDAFAVYLNGTFLLKTSNAADTLTFNSRAKSSHAALPGIYDEFDITALAGALRAGQNVLAVHGMNYSSSDLDLSSDLIFMPELWVQGASEGEYQAGEFRYFSPASPKAMNGSGYAGYVADTKFDINRGFYDTPVAVQITTETPGATIRYTTDGSPVSETTGTVYAGPVAIGTTTTLRAAAFKADHLPTNTDTHTYLFPSAVIQQPALPAGFPDHWGNDPSLPVAGASDTWVPADYQMDPRVVTDSRYSGELMAALTALPSMSLVMPTSDWFDPRVGIYSNKLDEGLAWERPVSAELIYPDGRVGFQADCGVRIQGGTSTANYSPTLWKCMKQSMRLLFKDNYGPPKLRFPLYADSRVQEFNTLVLDAHMNNSWVHSSDSSQRRRGDYARDAWMANMQTAMGTVGPHNIFVHLYINGLYWGVYELHEKPDEDFGADYFGGSPEDYDVLKHQYYTIVNGDNTAYRAMMTLADSGLADSARYETLQQQYLDLDWFIDYMLLNFYAGNSDWAHQNWYVCRSRQPGGLFRYLSWDAEHVIEDSVSYVGKMDADDSGALGPTHLHQRLMANAEYRLRFADHVHRHMFNGGVLSIDPANPVWTPDHPERNRPAAYYKERSNSIQSAVIMESARWGDIARPTQPYTRDVEWLTEQNRLVNTYFPARWNVMKQALESRGLYPTLSPPVFSQHGGAYSPGFQLTMTGPGDIWFTRDGTDPRLPGGEANGEAMIYTGPVSLTGTVRVKARTLSGATWSAVNEALFAPAGLPTIRITEIMYHPPAGGSFDEDEYEYLEIQNIGTLALQLEGVALSGGIEFVFPSLTLGPGGFIVVVENLAAFAERYGATATVAGQYTGKLKNSSDAVRLCDAVGQVIHDFIFSENWYPSTDGLGYSLCIRDAEGDLSTWGDPVHWRASTAVLGTPGRAEP